MSVYNSSDGSCKTRLNTDLSELSLNIFVLRFLFLQVDIKKHNCDTCIHVYFWVLMPALEATHLFNIASQQMAGNKIEPDLVL